MPCRHFWILPTSDFSEDAIASFDLSNTSPTDGTGYVLEVDLDSPRELYDLHSDYPLAAEKLKITRDMLSPYSESLVGERFMAQEKLSPNLYDKTKYVTHYENLKFYLEAGIKLKKISLIELDCTSISTPRRDVKQRHLFFSTLQKHEQYAF